MLLTVTCHDLAFRDAEHAVDLNLLRKFVESGTKPTLDHLPHARTGYPTVPLRRVRARDLALRIPAGS